MFQSFSNFSLRMKIMLAICLPLLALAVLSYLSIFSSNSLQSAARLVDTTHQVIEAAMEIEATVLNMETGMRGYLLSGKDNFLEPYESGRERFAALLENLEKEVASNPDQLKRLEIIRTSIDSWATDVAEPTLALRRKIGDSKTMDDIARLVGSGKGNKIVSSITALVGKFISAQRDRFEELREGEGTDAQEQAALVYDIIQQAADVQGSISNMLIGMRGFMLSGKDEFLLPYNTGQQRFDEQWDELQFMVGEDPEALATVNKIVEMVQKWKAEFAWSAILLRRKIGSAKP